MDRHRCLRSHRAVGCWRAVERLVLSPFAAWATLMKWPQRLLDYATLALLVAVALLVALCLDSAPSLRTRLWSVGDQWANAVEDTATTVTVAGGSMTATSTRDAAMQLLRTTIGGM